MNDSNQKSAGAGEGLRERKRRQTRERIGQAAMTLFIERGFDATTVDDIAAAADVSKRSFFDYFPTKEDVVFAWQDRFGDVLIAAVAARPTHEPLARAVEEALTSTVVAAVDPQSLAIAKLIAETPALRARDQLKYAKLEQKLTCALMERVKGEAGQLRARLVAMVAVGSLRVGAEVWHARRRAENVETYIKRVFKSLWAELREFGRVGGDDKQS